MLTFNSIKALYAHLVKELPDMVVVDKISETDKLPYLAFGVLTVESADTRTKAGKEITQQLVFYSQANGKKESIEATQKISRALSKEVLSDEVIFNKNDVVRVRTYQTNPEIYITEIDVQMHVEEV